MFATVTGFWADGLLLLGLFTIKDSKSIFLPGFDSFPSWLSTLAIGGWKVIIFMKVTHKLLTSIKILFGFDMDENIDRPCQAVYKDF
ncbi:MAG: hypothetical protein LBU69_06300 [Deltaproteobacteria bacterium]|nr:hypothetical protein [Deltaproteobacteria bacterium]